MTKVAPRGLITALLLTVVFSLPAAKVEAQTSEQVDSLISMIRELQQLVAEQALRISSLEEALRTMQRPSPASSLDQRPTPPEITGGAVQTNASGQPGWHIPENWDRIRTGMTYEEVVAILGPPTNIRGGYSLRTLQYHGEVPGSGFLRGDVGVYGDANTVFRIKHPDF